MLPILKVNSINIIVVFNVFLFNKEFSSFCGSIKSVGTARIVLRFISFRV